MKYQSVSVPEDLIKTMNKIDSSWNKIKINHFDSNQYIVQDDRSNNKVEDINLELVERSICRLVAL